MAGKKDFAHGEDVLTMLNRDLANELNTMLMYLGDGLLARGTDSMDLKEVSEKFAALDFAHARKLAARVVELEGVPAVMPINLQNDASIDVTLHDDGAITPILKDALECELQSVLELRNQIQRIGFSDPATVLLLQHILADKEHQVEEIRNLLGI